MNWLKRRSKKHEAGEATAGQTEASRALGRAEQAAEQVHKDEREILAAAARLKRLGERNDFAARIREAMGGPG